MDDIDVPHKRGSKLKEDAPMDDEGQPKEDSSFGGTKSKGATGGKYKEHASNCRDRKLASASEIL